MTEDLLRRAQLAAKFAQLSEDFNPYAKELYLLRDEVTSAGGPTKGLLYAEFRRAEAGVREIQHALNKLTTWALTGRLEEEQTCTK